MSSGTSILKSIIQAVNPKDKACYVHHSRWHTTTVLVGTSSGLKALVRNIFLGYITGVPSNLLASIVPKEKIVHPKNLLVALRAQWEGEDQFKVIMRGWYQRDYINVKMLLVGWKYEVVTDLLVNVRAVEHKNVIVALRAQWEGEGQFREIIRGWWTNQFEPPDYLGGNLKAFVQPYVEAYLIAELKITQPRDLLSYIKAWPYRNLQTLIYGWAISDLSAFIAERGEKYLVGSIGGHYPANLSVVIKAFYTGNYINLLSSVVSQHIFDLGVSLNYFYKEHVSLNAFLSCRPIYLLGASIVGWAHRDLYATLTTHKPPGYLPVTIVAHGGYNDLKSNIFGGLGVKNIKDLYVNISGWDYVNLLASISSINYVSLLASIVSVGGTKDLTANIKVKEIIFNEFYKFSTVNTSDLRAYIGFSLCTLRTPKSAYTSLLASLCAVITHDLGATIEGIKIKFSSSKNLGVFISYTNKYTMLSKFLSFKMSMSVSEVIRINPAFFKNSLNITFKIINGQVDLKTLITSQPHNIFLGATIRSRLLIVHGVGSDKILTEELVEIEGYIKKWSEYVDVYLKTERPIYYSGGCVFSKNYGEPIMSFIFKYVSAGGAQYEYDLSHDMYFDSTDSAIRYGFSRISGRTALVSLSATIQPIVKSLKLSVKIEGKEKINLYLNSPFTYLKSGSLSFMGTCINNISYKSKSNIFGGIQDMSSSISATPN